MHSCRTHCRLRRQLLLVHMCPRGLDTHLYIHHPKSLDNHPRPSHPLLLDHSCNNTLHQPNRLHRPWDHPPQTLPVTLTEKVPSLIPRIQVLQHLHQRSGGTLNFKPVPLLFHVPNIPSPKSQSLFELWQLRRSFRSSLSLRQQLHRKKKLPLLHPFFSWRRQLFCHARSEHRSLPDGHWVRQFNGCHCSQRRSCKCHRTTVGWLFDIPCIHHFFRKNHQGSSKKDR